MQNAPTMDSRNEKEELKIKTSKALQTNIKDDTQQTPIEIALKIDNNGMTLASQLYHFLELNPSNFTKWCKRNIIDNSFASEDTDYFRLVVEYESANNVKLKKRTDYKLTSEFAKKLSMTGNTDRHEEARKYFIACEQGLKVATKKLQESQLDTKLLESLTNVTTTLASINERISNLETSTHKKQLPEKKYSRWKTKTFEKLRLFQEFVNTNSNEDLTLADTIRLVIGEAQDIYDIDLSEYRDMYKCEFGLDENPYPLDVINYYKDIRDVYTHTLDNIMDQLHIEKTSKATENIFDLLAKKLYSDNNTTQNKEELINNL